MVTGAGGQIGRFLRRAWLEEPPRDIRPFWIGRGEGFDLTWDILSDAAPVWPKNAVVLHLAGVVRGDETALAANVAMVAPVLRACRRNAACALFVASTAAVYAPGPQPATEDWLSAPANAYGRSKALAERRFLAGEPGFSVHVLRLGNVAGAESLLGPRPTDEVIRLDPVPGRKGGPLRSWIGPRTLAQVLTCLCRRAAKRADLPSILNVAADPPLQMADLLRASGRAWVYGPENPAVTPVATLSTERLRALCPLPPATAESLLAEVAACASVTK